MPTGRFEKDSALQDAVIVEGAFFSSFLASTPPVYVKLYLYLLYLCRHPESKLSSSEEVSAASGIGHKDVLEGMEYFSTLQLLTYTRQPFTFEMRSCAVAAAHAGAYTPGELTAYRDYFAGLRSLLPTRSIKPQEYDRARDWVEVYGITPEAALLLVSHCTALKGTSLSFQYIDTVALAWANDGITTAQAAEEYLSLYEARHHDAAKVLLHLGMKRTPSVDEMRLYNRWSSDYGFDLAAILAACAETTKAHAPSFGYLDGILRSFHQLGLHNASEIRAYLSESTEERRLLSTLLFELGERSRGIGPAETDALKALQADGFTPEVLLRAARESAACGSHSFRLFASRMDALAKQGDRTASGLKELISAAGRGTARPAKASSAANFTQRTEDGAKFTDVNSLEDV